MGTLAKEEREVIVTYNDAEKTWCVYSDSATMRGRILRLARQLGVEVRRVGTHGVEFTCPTDALRLTAKRRVRLSPEARTAQALRLPHPLVPAGVKRGKVAILESPAAAGDGRPAQAGPAAADAGLEMSWRAETAQDDSLRVSRFRAEVWLRAPSWWPC